MACVHVTKFKKNMRDNSKRTEKSKQDRFYVGDVIENIVTHKKLEVGEVFLTDEHNVLLYGLYNIGSGDKYDFYKDFNRDIPPSAFNHWKRIN